MRFAGTNVKITEEEISEVKDLYKLTGSYAETGRQLNMTGMTVSQIVRGLGRFAENGHISAGRIKITEEEKC